MFDQERFVYVSLHVDANRVNARTTLPNMNRLEKWRDDEVILMQMSRTAQEEAAAGGSAARSQKARSYIFTLTGNLIDEERRQVDAIERVLFPIGAVTPNERNDVDVVFNATKYGAILVTADGASKRQPGGILGNRAGLAALGVQVMTDDEAVAHVRRKIHERDELAVWRARRDGKPVPAWVGAD
jgi:hypothetical protein